MNDVKTNSFRAWWLGIRPNTLTGAIAPVLVGIAFAIVDTPATGLGSLLVPGLLCLLFAMLMQTAANLINDYVDFLKGTDRDDRLGPERAFSQGWITQRAMRRGIGIITLLACVVGLFVMFCHAQYELLLVGVLCVAFAFLYTTHLSYLGWGDLLVVIFFGLVPVACTYYVLTDGGFTTPVLLTALAIGLVTDNLLMVNNYRDRNQDPISGKRTIVVHIVEAMVRKYGETEGRIRGERLCVNIYLWLGIVAIILSWAALCLQPTTPAYIPPLTLIYLPLHLHGYRLLRTIEGYALNRVLGMTARNIFIFGILLVIHILLFQLPI